MFLHLMEEAMAELKGEPLKENLEPEINVSMSAFLPETYIPSIDERLSIYRRLARMKTLKEISDMKAELEDRFGALPQQAGRLLMKIMMRVLAIQAGVRRPGFRPGPADSPFFRRPFEKPHGPHRFGEHGRKAVSIHRGQRDGSANASQWKNRAVSRG